MVLHSSKKKRCCIHDTLPPNDLVILIALSSRAYV